MNESPSVLLKKGQSLLNLGNPKEALDIYEIILKDEPQNIEALIKKGHILGMIGRYAQAIDSYDRVLSLGLCHRTLLKFHILLSNDVQVLCLTEQ